MWTHALVPPVGPQDGRKSSVMANLSTNLRWRGKTEEEDELGGILRRVARLVGEM